MEQVTLVVNFDLPVDLSGRADNDTYLHRIGRSGRFGKRGFAVNLVDSQRSLDIIRQIESHFGENRRTSAVSKRPPVKVLTGLLLSSQDRKIKKLDMDELDELE